MSEKNLFLIPQLLFLVPLSIAACFDIFRGQLEYPALLIGILWIYTAWLLVRLYDLYKKDGKNW
jgi:hypothetical protein